jgi:hypothetical protein
MTENGETAVADPKPKRGRKAAPPKERKLRTVKPAEHVIQQKLPAGEGLDWKDVATKFDNGEAFSDTTDAMYFIKFQMESGNWPAATYRIVAVKRTLEAKVETEKRVVFV